MKKIKRIILCSVILTLFCSIVPIQANTIEYDATEVQSNVKEETISNTEVVTLSKDKSYKYTILYIHGGGYMNDINAYQWNYADTLAQKLNAQVIVPLYKTIGNGTWKDAYQLLSILYSSIRSSTKNPVILLGDSAGGGLALGFDEYLAKQGKKQPTKTILFSPWLDLTCSNSEIANYEARDSRLSVSQLVEYGSQWANGLDMTDYKLSPINGDISKLNNIYFFVGTEEIFYPDITSFYEKLKTKGKNVKLTVGDGCMHDYPLYINQIDESDEALQEVINYIKT